MDNKDTTVRLHKFMADAGLASRRKCELLIEAGKVYVNGQRVTARGIKIIPDKDVVSYGGKIISVKKELKYVMLHKPEGVISSVSDPKGRRVVTDLIKDIPGRLFPVGRLDYDSSGLIIMTNDGGLAQRLTHPSHHMPKTYIAELDKLPTKGGLNAFRTGLKIDGGPKTAAAKIKILSTKQGGATAQIIIYEGRNRQIRKMCEAIGTRVLRLKRVAVGGLKLGNLPRGGYRFLTGDEVRGLLP